MSHRDSSIGSSTATASSTTGGGLSSLFPNLDVPLSSPQSTDPRRHSPPLFPSLHRSRSPSTAAASLSGQRHSLPSAHSCPGRPRSSPARPPLRRQITIVRSRRGRCPHLPSRSPTRCRWDLQQGWRRALLVSPQQSAPIPCLSHALRWPGTTPSPLHRLASVCSSVGRSQRRHIKDSASLPSRWWRWLPPESL
ncbi:hypothetical protein OsI_33058 [Oryza sativa Indica Group]|uniref:Uncharacterized protein n=1 Tax=Oryza sativa subsp. indica TaxID=39946 RepID=B8BG70_ORYSI|nr:hypothetical protein OsI_33058 [Oryza sativa Indica Group]